MLPSTPQKTGPGQPGQNGQTVQPTPSPQSSAPPRTSTPTPAPVPTSTPGGSGGPAVVLSAGYGDLMDSYTGRMQWVTQQDPGALSALRASYVDFYISAVREVMNGGGAQPDWNTVNVHEDAFSHGADPASLTTQPQEGAVTLHWNVDARAAMGVPLSGYVVYEGTSPQSLTAVATLPNSASSYSASGLSDGTTYYFAVHSLLNGSDSVYSGVQSAAAGVPSGFVLDSPTYSTNVPIAPGANVTLTVRAHASGAALPSSLLLQTLVKPHPTTPPSSTAMNSVGGGYYQGSATVTIPSGYYGGIAFRVADATGNAVLPTQANQSYYVTAPNNRLHFGVYANNYVMDAGSPMWHSLLTDYIAGRLAAGYKGVLLDDVGTKLDGARPEAFPAGYSANGYLNNMISHLAYLRSHIGSGYSICANAFSDPAATAYVPYVQRGEIEEIAYDVNSWGYAPEWYWQSSVNSALTITQQYNIGSRMLVDASESDTAARSYILGTYLLIQNRNLYYDLETSAGLGYYYPEYGLSLGPAEQNFTTIAQAYVAADQAYERTFANGRVIVNPSSTAITPVIQLGAAYKQVRLAGGAVEHGGSIETTLVTQVQLLPHQAAILIR